MKDFKNYKRIPIQLSERSIMLIHLFSDIDHSFKHLFESIDIIDENQAATSYSDKQYEIAAEQFFDQLEGQYCDAFLKALIVKATNLLVKTTG